MNHTYNPNKVIVHGTFVDSDTFFIWAEQKRQKKYQEYANFMYPFLYPPFELKLALFRYHHASFFGTFINIEKLLIEVPLLERHFYSEAGNVPVYQANNQDETYVYPIEGILLPTKELPNYIETIKEWMNTEEWLIADDLQFWIALFQQIQVDIAGGLFLPTGEGYWKLTTIESKEWIKSMPPSCLAIRKQSIAIRKKEQHFLNQEGLESIIQLLADRLIRSLIGIEPKMEQAISKLKDNKPESIRTLIQALEAPDPCILEQPVEEMFFLEEIGILPKTPFHTGIEVMEPTTTDIPWKLSLFVQDREDPSIVIKMNELQQGKHPWRINPVPKIKQDIHLGAKTVPLLQGFSLSNAELEITADEVSHFLMEDSNNLQQLGFTIFVPSWMKDWRKDYTIKVRLDSAQPYQTSSVDPVMNWSSLTSFEYDVSIGNTTLSEDEFTKLVKSKEALVFVRGKWMMWDPVSAKRLKQQLDKKKDKKISFFDAWQAQLQQGKKEKVLQDVTDELLEYDWDVDWDNQTDSMLQIIQRKEINTLDVPPSLKGTLRPYQQQGYSWLVSMRQIGFGACLADDMGLGKSIQTIAYILKVLEMQRAEEVNTNPFLLICPTSLIGNWGYELKQFAPNLRVFVHHGDNRLSEELEQQTKKYDVIITSYALAVRDEQLWTTHLWNGLILDEAQQLKNIQTKQRRSIKKISATHRIALTGTPIENRLTELWSMIDLLNHGFLGSFRHFQQTFIREIEGATKNEERLEQLQLLISPFLLRRKKSDPNLELQLPNKHEQTHIVGLTVEQASLYQVVVNELLENVNRVSELERRALILSSLTKLKQICNHPAQFLKDNGPLENRSEKWELLLTLLEQIIENGEKTLIFSQYREMGELLQQGISEAFGMEVPFLHGSLPRAKREELIQSFKQDKDKQIFILSLKAGGVGLNLTAANHVIHYDRWWNPAVENQATDRAYRIGQKQHVTVHKMVTKGTLEEKIDEMLKQKQQLADQVLSGGDGRLSELSHEELRELLELRG